ncbi:DUF983 domain-containing protein [Sphingomonas sp. ASY06-1R]|jgi:uncharacterized protein (DUF983 family)|uniref:DUF983 domain-containing protein n=1 Tax=Sphingomonas sp. ASY06-1R TaxID=3445771 RepID=UPI003FA21A63
MASVPPSPIVAGLTGCCPRCGARSLFAGWIKFADRCTHCGLDFSGFNVGDGPAAFLTLILGGLVAAMAIMVELTFSPPFWVHLLLWPPITLALIVASLRASKGVLLVLEYRNAAREGRINPL